VSGLRRCYDCLGDLFHLQAKDTTDYLLAQLKSARAEARRREASRSPRLLLPPAPAEHAGVKETEAADTEFHKRRWPARVFWEMLPDGEFRLLSDPRELSRVWVDEQGDLLAVTLGTEVLEIVRSCTTSVDPWGELWPEGRLIGRDPCLIPGVRIIGE
jgi:hypothetical protein